MISPFTVDAFGLSHAVVSARKGNAAANLMVVQADAGWWAYVDGERVGQTFRSRGQAQNAARRAARRKLRVLRTVSWRSVSLIGGCIAAVIAILMIQPELLNFMKSPESDYRAAHARSDSVRPPAATVRDPNEEKPEPELGPSRVVRWSDSNLSRLKPASRKVTRANRRRIRARRSRYRRVRPRKSQVWGRDIPMPARD